DDADDSLDTSTASTSYADSDGDGYGDPDGDLLSCEAPSGNVANNEDCDDGAAGVSPAGTELCDGLDNNCDGATDEGAAADAATWYDDADGDGFGDPSATSVACDQPSGAVSDASDCDDGDAAVNPGASEVCDSADNDC
ncbi:putative metal-binding motif-containing protein, partial [Myxococcota bacterium]|nr:putative metal-binding motif-containing protein [Myxococcota bacterium]